jgi:ATP-dependent exoDNAse (exonuclease V) beta subunit
VSEFDRCFEKLYAASDSTARVELMTIHRAKGLEFDFVILPGLHRPPRQRSGDFFLAHSFARAGGQGLVMAVKARMDARSDGLFDFLLSEAKDADRLEAERLLYVACTRAKRELHLCAVTLTRSQSAEAPAGSLLQVLLQVAPTEFSLSPAPTTAKAPAPQGGLFRRFPADWAATHAAGLPRAPLLAAAFDVAAPPFDWAGETARQIGTLVHAELQDFANRRRADIHLASRLGGYRHWLTCRGVPDERLSEALARVEEALAAVLNDEKAKWILFEPHREAASELALTGVIDGEIISGVLDRSFIDAVGTRWIVDYKTSPHRGGGLADFLASELARYRPQLARYAALAARLGPEPVRAGLYFPLLRAWVTD